MAVSRAQILHLTLLAGLSPSKHSCKGAHVGFDSKLPFSRLSQKRETPPSGWKTALLSSSISPFTQRENSSLQNKQVCRPNFPKSPKCRRRLAFRKRGLCRPTFERYTCAELSLSPNEWGSLSLSLSLSPLRRRRGGLEHDFRARSHARVGNVLF